jgi:hypothetical protein
MKVTIVRGGGVGGMTTRTQLESDALPGADAQALSSHIQGAALQAGSAPGSGTRSPDELLYEISVNDGGNDVTQRFTENTMPEGVRQLVQWVDSRPERTDSID